jgi:hypothetical protein
MEEARSPKSGYRFSEKDRARKEAKARLRWHRAWHEDPMVEKCITASQNVIDLAAFRERNNGAKVGPMSLRVCRHCGAVLADGEREEECSSTFNVEAAQLRWQAAQILRGLV